MPLNSFSRMKWLFLALGSALSLGVAHAQNSGLSALQQALNDDLYDEVLRGVASLERRHGQTPRLESLKAYALAGSNKTVEALERVLVYEQLVGGKLGADHPGHADMLALKSSLQQHLKSEIEGQLAERRKQREVLAGETARLESQQKQEADKKTEVFRKKNDERLKQAQHELSEDEFRTLVITGSTSSLAKTDLRALDIGSFSSGIFHLGARVEEFEKWLRHRASLYPANNPRAENLKRDFSVVYDDEELHEKGNLKKYNLKFIPYGKGSVESFFGDKYGSREYNDHYREEVEAFNSFIAQGTIAPEIVDIAPGAIRCGMQNVTFDRTGVLSNMMFTCLYPFSHSDLEGMMQGALERFGTPNKLERSSSYFGRKVSATYSVHGGKILWVSVHESLGAKKRQIGPPLLYFSFSQPVSKPSNEIPKPVVPDISDSGRPQ